MSHPILNRLPLLGPILVLMVVAWIAWHGAKPRSGDPDDLPEAVLEFRHLSAVRFDRDSGKPSFRESLRKLEGKQVAIAGYMTDSPAAENPGDYRSFRLVENDPRMLLRPPAANEAIFVERKIREDPEKIWTYPLIEGGIAVRGILRLAGFPHQNRGLENRYWFAIEDAEIDPLSPP